MKGIKMSLLTFTELAGVPVHYDRYEESSGFGYATKGKPFKPRATKLTINTLNICFDELFNKSPFGSGEVITSAGAFVDKRGQHGIGRAFDLDGIFWAEKKLIAIEYPKKPHLYLAVESVLRKHFGTVLNYNYNNAHKDHFHIDTGSSVKFEKMSKSRVEYLQATMFYIHGFQVGIDGIWGPETQSVSSAVLNELGIVGGLFNIDNWLEFLTLSATKGFELVNT